MRIARTSKIAMLRGGLLGALLLLVCVGLLQALGSRVQGAGEVGEYSRSHAARRSGSAPGQVQKASPLQGTEITDPARVSTPLLHLARAGTAGGGSYLELGGPSGRWSVARRSVSSLARPAGAISAAGTALRITLPASMVRDHCLYADATWKRSASVSWSDSTGAAAASAGREGRRTVAVGCPSGLEGEELFHLNIRARVDGDPHASPPVVVHGLWLVDPDEPGAPATSGLVPCEPGPGLRLRPGWSLSFPFLAGQGDEVRVRLQGEGSADAIVTIRTDGQPDVAIPVGTLRGDGLIDVSAQLEHSVTRPAELTLQLPAGVESDCCVLEVAVATPPPEPVLAGAPEVQGVVLILVDTLRADVLGLYAPEQGVSAPAWEELAGESIFFTRSTAHANYTKPSVGTILSGVYPHVHDGLPPMNRLDPSVELLPERLHRAGVQAVGLFSNHFLNNRKFGFWRGWDHHEHVNSYTACLGGEPVVERLPGVIEQLEPSQPYFLYIHLMDPHSPYNPPPSYQVQHLGHQVISGRILPRETSMFIRKVRRGDVPPPDEDEVQLLLGLYRADVDHMDDVFGMVVQELRSSGLLDQALLVVTSDHGEEFTEHGGLGHGTNLFEELVHVPLLIRLPGGQVHATVSEQVGHVDLVPTILDVLGAEAPVGGLSGRSLMTLLTGGEAHWTRQGYLLEHRNNREKGVMLAGYKLLIRGDRLVMTHLEGLGEQEISIAEHPLTYRQLRARFLELMQQGQEAGETPAVQVELDEEELEKLRALGYIMQ